MDKFLVELNKKLCPVIYCGDDWKTKQKKIIYGTNTCEADCEGYKYENNGICYSSCPEGADFCTPEVTTDIASNFVISDKISNSIYNDNISDKLSQELSDKTSNDNDNLLSDKSDHNPDDDISNDSSDNIVDNNSVTLSGDNNEEIHQNINLRFH